VNDVSQQLEVMSCCCPSCCCPLEGTKHMNARGLDRKPTTDEALEPPDKRPWTEYDVDGNTQKKPNFKACAPKICCLCGPTCCVFELQWCSACVADADTTCDVLCRCQTNRMKACICCGPQRDDVDCDCIRKCCPLCCGPGKWNASAKMTMTECCSCDCIENQCGWRYSGCQPPCLCCHVTCVMCPPCCPNFLCCQEEIIYMDGDLKPMVMDRVELVGNDKL